jgi:hypothetical protein
VRIALAALLLACWTPALGAQKAEARRGLVIHVKVTGTVVPDDVFRLKSTIDGRVESVNASSFSWRGADEPLAVLAYKELAAMIDAKGSQNQNVMEDHWSSVYRPTPVRCPDVCYVLKVFVRPHAWVKPQAVMFEAAHGLKLVGRATREDSLLIRAGMPMTYWAANNPKRRLTGRVDTFTLDGRGETGGTVTLALAPGSSLDPGTQWEGEIVPPIKSNAIMAPTAALIHVDGATYLPIRVSTGMTSTEYTEITAGLSERREVLILDDSQLHGAERHKATVDPAELEARMNERPEPAARDSSETPAPTAAPAAEEAKPERQPATLDDKNYGGEDPYGEQ